MYFQNTLEKEYFSHPDETKPLQSDENSKHQWHLFSLLFYILYIILQCSVKFIIFKSVKLSFKHNLKC